MPKQVEEPSIAVGNLPSCHPDVIAEILNDLGVHDPRHRSAAGAQLHAHANAFALGRYIQANYPTVHQDAGRLRGVHDAINNVLIQLGMLHPVVSLGVNEAIKDRSDNKFALGDVTDSMRVLSNIAHKFGTAKFARRRPDEVLRQSVGGLMLCLEKITGNLATVQRRRSDQGLPPQLSSPEAKAIARLLRVSQPDLADTTLVDLMAKIGRISAENRQQQFGFQLLLGGTIRPH